MRGGSYQKLKKRGTFFNVNCERFGGERKVSGAGIVGHSRKVAPEDKPHGGSESEGRKKSAL